MSKLFLASNFYTVAPMVSRILKNSQQGKKALFITTAAEVEEGDKSWLNADRDALQKMGLKVSDYSIVDKKESDFEKDFKDVNYVLVSGGNVFYLLQEAQNSGFIPFIKNFVEKADNVYFGSSAGAVVTGQDLSILSILDDRSKAPKVIDTFGFGFIDLCLLVHWGSDNFKKSYTTGLAELYTENYKTILLTNNQFLRVENGAYELVEV